MGSIETAESLDARNPLFDQANIKSSAFWETYKKSRPRVPPSLFARVYDYHHKLHGGTFDIVNDVGAGVGNFSSELAKRFAEVIVTEPNRDSLLLAQKHLTPGGTFRRLFRFVNENIEDVSADAVPPGSVDMVFAANVMHWVDLDRALEAIARQLKPGGTFFAGLWGMLVLVDKEADEVWMRIMESVTQACLDAFPARLRRELLEVQDSGYDAIALSEEVWELGVMRVKLNAGDKDTFRMARTRKWSEGLPIVSKVGKHDKVDFLEDRDWFVETDLGGLKALTESYPGRPPIEIMEPLWREMESVLVDGKCRGFFPASLILATKK